ncbi:patatin family protein [Olsenella uli]|uniref:patatin-like phospholipase family protein n=1 Tax=Olsenella uli TaxID=133926 RepID=UPI00195DCB8F|nr:patatin family protein [Olsenella uli]MBM6676500.1 patatin family protein [Olsenella uli]
MSDEKNGGVAPALVLEGGGFRGMFTAGVLDVLQERELYGFSSIWGVSAGAVNAANFRSRQIGRTMRDILAFRDDRRFMSLWSFVTTGDAAGADFMYDEVQNHLDPCDVETFNASEIPLWVVVSDVTFGTPDYLRVERFPEDLERVRASASLPTVSRLVEIDGHRYLDGGTTDSIPFAAALGLPDAPEVAGRPAADRALVVLTQDRGFVREQAGSGEQIALRSHRYDRYPYYLEALRTRAERYNAQRERLWELEREGRCLVVAPEEPVSVGSSTRDGESLLSLYVAGRRQATERIAEIEAFLG